MTDGIAHYLDADSREQLFRAAFNLYRYGSSSSAGGSLSHIARDANRDVVPVFESFKRYFQVDSNYADTLIVSRARSPGNFSFLSAGS